MLGQLLVLNSSRNVSARPGPGTDVSQTHTYLGPSTPLPTTTTHVHYRVRLTRGCLLALLPGLHLRAALARLVARVLLVDDVVAAAAADDLAGSKHQEWFDDTYTIL